MPAALEVDREQVKIVALSVGVREAARQFGLAEGTVQYWSANEEWFKKDEAVKAIQAQAVERKREAQGLQPSSTKSASEVLKHYDGESRFFVAKGLHAGAEAISRMDGQEVVMASQQVGQTVKSLALVHGWASNHVVSVLGEVVSGAVPDLPDSVIDV